MAGVNTQPFDIVVGPGSIWVSPVGTVFPVVDLEAPAAPWISLGETDGGLEFIAKRSTKTHFADQSLAADKTTVDIKGIELSFTLAQITLERLATVLDGQTITTVAAGEYTAGYKEIILSALATLPQYAMLVRVPSPYADGYLQYQLARVSPSGDMKMSYKKDAPTLIPTTWNVMKDPGTPGSFGTIKAFTAAAGLPGYTLNAYTLAAATRTYALAGPAVGLAYAPALFNGLLLLEDGTFLLLENGDTLRGG